MTATVEELPALTLDQSYRICRALHRRHGTTYFWASRALPRVKWHHVDALYGLCRFADEIVDDPHVGSDGERLRLLNALEHTLEHGLVHRESDHPVLRAVVFTARAHRLPASAFRRFFASMRADLTVSSYRSYADLEGYMDGSAAVIGELMLPILEPRSTDAVGGARDLGVAFQLTNFLRDVGEDLERARVYFPTDELDAFGVDIHRRRVTPMWREFCRYQIERIGALYTSADEAIALLPPSSARSIRAARILYAEILDRIVDNDYDVFSRRARVPLRRKLGVVGRGWMGP